MNLFTQWAHPNIATRQHHTSTRRKEFFHHELEAMFDLDEARAESTLRRAEPGSYEYLVAQRTLDHDGT